MSRRKIKKHKKRVKGYVVLNAPPKDKKNKGQPYIVVDEDGNKVMSSD